MPRVSLLVGTSGAVGLLVALYLQRRRRHLRLQLPLDSSLAARYGLDPCMGFILHVSQEPLQSGAQAWEALAAALPEYNRAGSLRAAVDTLPLVHLPADFDEPQLRRARVILGTLVHSYVHGERVPWSCLEDATGLDEQTRYVYQPAVSALPSAPSATSVPPQLAVPWVEVSSALGLPLILTATDVDLWNVRPLPRSVAPRDALQGVRQLVSMTGTRSERGFHSLPHAIQLALTPTLPTLLATPALVAAKEAAALESACDVIASALANVRALLPSVTDLVDVDEFYDVYRLLLGGWPDDGVTMQASSDAWSEAASREGVASEAGEGATASPAAPDGAAAEDGTHEDVVAKLGGPSAGQTAVLMLVDLCVGLQHGPQLSAFQREMSETYLPGRHRELLSSMRAQLDASGTLRDAAAAAGAPAGLIAAHARAVKELAGMRAFHMGIATNYLRKALKGTGGSDFRALLDEGLRSTRATAVAPAR